MQFYRSGRMDAEVDPLLNHYYADVLKDPVFLEALHWYDVANVVMLVEHGTIPRDAGKAILEVLERERASGVPESRRDLEATVHSGELVARGQLGEEVSGWMHVGRSSPSIRVVASRISVRERVIDLAGTLNVLRAVMAELAERHADAVMPGSSYLQPIEITTFGHYCLSWIDTFGRDVERFEGLFGRTNLGSGGTEAAYGTAYDLDLDRLNDLLGFPCQATNTRDAIRQYDYLAEAFAAVAIMMNSLGRLAADLIVWNSSEYRYVEAPEKYVYTSSVAPQMRIPWMQEVVNGLSGVAAGRLAGALAVSKTMSDQLEPATLMPVELWDTMQESGRALRVMTELMDGLVVHRETMAESARQSWAQMSTVMVYLVTECGVSYRSAHQVVARACKRLADAGEPPSSLTSEVLEQSAEAYLGRRIEVSPTELEACLDPEHCVSLRTSPGGTAPVEVRRAAGEAKDAIRQDTIRWTRRAQHIEEARARTWERAQAITSAPVQ